jgi:hypothetical protein
MTIYQPSPHLARGSEACSGLPHGWCVAIESASRRVLLRPIDATPPLEASIHRGSRFRPVPEGGVR